MELASFHYDVKYRPGRLNHAADALTRVKKRKSGFVSSLVGTNQLYKVHKDLGCPGISITRMFHQVKIRNLPYTLKDV